MRASATRQTPLVVPKRKAVKGKAAAGGDYDAQDPLLACCSDPPGLGGHLSPAAGPVTCGLPTVPAR
eukprot:5610744-Pyramimonas_sp.AAC.1